MSIRTRRTILHLAATIGLAALGSPLRADDDARRDDRWRAWAVTEGDETRLVVEGIYSQGGPGRVVLFKEVETKGGKTLVLELRPANLPGIFPAVLQPVPACFNKTPYKKDQYQSVEIRYPDGGVMKIDRIIDTGKGPR